MKAREKEIKKRLFEISTSNFNNSVEDSRAYFKGYIDGAMWADRTMIDKACDWLYAHLYTRRDEQSPANHFVRSKQEMLTQTEFVEQFKQAMKGE